MTTLAHAFSSAYKELEGDEEEINNLICSTGRHPSEDLIFQAMESRPEDLMVLTDGSVVQVYDGCSWWNSVKDLFLLGAQWNTEGEYTDEALEQRLAMEAYERIKDLI